MTGPTPAEDAARGIPADLDYQLAPANWITMPPGALAAGALICLTVGFIFGYALAVLR